MLEHDGNLSSSAGNPDALVSGIFGKAQALGAEGKHRRARVKAVEAPVIYFAEMAKELGLGAAVPGDQSLEPGKKGVVGEFCEGRGGHLLSIARAFSALSLAAGAAFFGKLEVRNETSTSPSAEVGHRSSVVGCPQSAIGNR
jgi:hypothetical protein